MWPIWPCYCNRCAPVLVCPYWHAWPGSVALIRYWAMGISLAAYQVFGMGFPRLDGHLS